MSGGKIVAAALETDRLGFLQAIGVVPPNGLRPAFSISCDRSRVLLTPAA